MCITCLVPYLRIRFDSWEFLIIHVCQKLCENVRVWRLFLCFHFIFFFLKNHIYRDYLQRIFTYKIAPSISSKTFWSNGLLVKALHFQSRGLLFKTTGWLRVWQLVYVAYVRAPTFIGVPMILDIGTLTSRLTFSIWYFKVLEMFLVLIFYTVLKGAAIYLLFIFIYFIYIYSIITSIHMYALYLYFYHYLFGIWRNKFFAVYTSFKLFFNFSYKLFSKYFSLPQNTCLFRVSVRNQAKIVMHMYIIFIISLWHYEKTVHAHNYWFFWKGLCFNYLISILWL